VSEKGEATKRATAAAAGMLQPGASRSAPVEHPYREVVCLPRIFNHIVLSRSFFGSDSVRVCSSARHVPVTRFPVSQRRFRLDPDSASLQLAVVQKDRTRQPHRRPPPFPRPRTRGRALKPDR